RPGVDVLRVHAMAPHCCGQSDRSSPSERVGDGHSSGAVDRGCDDDRADDGFSSSRPPTEHRDGWEMTLTSPGLCCGSCGNRLNVEVSERTADDACHDSYCACGTSACQFSSVVNTPSAVRRSKKVTSCDACASDSSTPTSMWWRMP